VTQAPTPANFLTAYQAGKLAPFFEISPQDFEHALAQPRVQDRERLADALQVSLAPFLPPQAVGDSLERLRHAESRVIVTGQQAGLLLGPMYTLSKAMTAIRLAARLNTEDRPVVPVFWVASQDHDTAEIDTVKLLDFDETLHSLQLSLPRGVASSQIPMTSESLEKTLTGIRQGRFKPPFVDEVTQLLEGTARHSQSFADWFTAQLLALLGPHGLVVLDPSKPEIAELFTPVLKRELNDPLASSLEITRAGEALSAQGFTPQLSRAEGATNLFIQEDKRALLRFDGETFYTDTRQYSQAELQEMLTQEPQRLTPAAGLRPITQDALLPTLATVVGPGELQYFAQLKDVYALHEVSMPLIWPRMTVTVLEPPVKRLLDKYGLSAAVAQTDLTSRLEQELLERHGFAGRFEETLDTLNSAVTALLKDVKQIDPTLTGTVNRGEGYLRQTVGTLRNKTVRALAGKDSVTTQQFNRLKAHLYPEGIPQERHISPYSFFLKFGIAPVLAALLELPPEGEQIVIF
jgi:bacillithiol biosynthesis cysteine-adding enzyme BshC